MIDQMSKRVGVYHYFFPTHTMGRKVLWDGIDYHGKPFLAHFPKEFIARRNESQMKITTVNGSMFQVIGTDRLDIVGTNPIGCVFSEYSLQNPKGWDLIRPILAENDGWACLNWTPKGMNHAWRLDKMARGNPKWYYQRLTVDDTVNVISQEAIDEERLSGMSEEMVQQEFYCDYTAGAVGSYYGRYLSQLWKKGQIGNVAHDKHALVHTAWDLGIGDCMVCWFFQVCGNEIHLIDYYENYGEAIEHYARTLAERKEENGYLYGTHYAPHDIGKRELGPGKTIFESAQEAGLEYHKLPREHRVETGIERVRGILYRCWFDAKKCEQGISALESYRKEYRDKYQTYSDNPLHDWASHGADAFRYLSMALGKITTKRGCTLEEIEQMQIEAGLK